MARRRNRSKIEEFFYDLRYRMGEYSMRAFIRSVGWSPRWILNGFLSFTSRMSFALLAEYRSRMQANLALALGEEIKDERERKALVWRAWQNFGRGVLDTTVVMHYSKEQFIARVQIEGEEHLQRALAKGKGVLALSAHLGGFTLIGGRLAASGYPFSILVKHPSHERFARKLDDYRAQIGIHTISAKPRREAVRGILRALRENRVVLMIADEFKSGDLMIEFFGQVCAAPRGPASLALRTGAVTLPMFAVRRADDSFLLTIDPAIEPVQKANLEDSIAATTVIYSRRIEEEIRRYPDQWNWLGFPSKDGRISRAEYARLWKLRKAGRESAAQNGDDKIATQAALSHPERDRVSE
jgi:KDO2-lipid IV(A) lauroyltransferase